MSSDCARRRERNNRCSCWPASRTASRGSDEVAAATALVGVASVVLGLLGAQHEAATDELTGCLNRRAALARLREEIARASRPLRGED